MVGIDASRELTWRVTPGVCARMAALTCALTLFAGCSKPPVQPTPQSMPDTSKIAASAIFPLSRHPDHRCLVDTGKQPFLFHGDAAWSLIVQLTREDADRYMDDRSRRGFNTLMVNVLEHHFAADPPRNAFGDGPFTVPGNFATPNERYFAHVDWILKRAAERGFLVLLAPAYLGYGGGEEGWYQEMQKAGPQRLRMYGRYLGMRYALVQNVIWLHGGDYDPPDRAPMLALVDGLREASPKSLHSFHGGRGTTARQFLGQDSKWLNLNTVYTDEKSVTLKSLTEYSTSSMPFIFIEGQYENAGANELIVRSQAFQAMLSGACGQLMGNKPVWTFDPAWKSALDSPGARSMTRFRALLEKYRWSEMRPAPAGFLVEGTAAGSERAVASFSADARRAMVYVPTGRSLVLDTSIAGTARFTGRWIDPTGDPSNATVGFPVAGNRKSLTTPGKNTSGYNDWLLVLESQ